MLCGDAYQLKKTRDDTSKAKTQKWCVTAVVSSFKSLRPLLTIVQFFFSRSLKMFLFVRFSFPLPYNDTIFLSSTLSICYMCGNGLSTICKSCTPHKKKIAQKKQLHSAHHGTSSSNIPTAFLTHHGPPSTKRHINHGTNIISRAVVVFNVVVDAE